MDAHTEFGAAVTGKTEAAAVAKVARAEMTVGKVYNSTENPIDYITHHDWDGQFVSFPKTIAKAGSAKFTHSPRCGRDSGALVYRCKSHCACDKDWMFSWTNKPGKKAYTEIQKAGYAWDWSKVKNQTDKSTAESTYEADGFSATVSFDKDGYKAVITSAD